MRFKYTVDYRIAGLGFIAGIVLETLLLGKLAVPISGDIATIIIAVAETIVAVVLLISASIEGYSFLWVGLTNTMNA